MKLIVVIEMDPFSLKISHGKKEKKSCDQNLEGVEIFCLLLENVVNIET